MPKSGIKGDLGNEIRRRVGGVSSAGVVGVARARFAEQEIVRVVMRGQGALRVFDCESDRHLIAEVFRDAKTVLASERKTDVVTRIDGRGPGIVDFTQIVAGRDSCSVLGHQTPCLAAQEFPAIIKLGLAPRLTEAESVAVGLGGGGGHTGREKVGRDVGGKIHIIQASPYKDRGARLAGGAKELRQLALRSAG